MSQSAHLQLKYCTINVGIVTCITKILQHCRCSWHKHALPIEQHAWGILLVDDSHVLAASAQRQFKDDACAAAGHSAHEMPAASAQIAPEADFMRILSRSASEQTGCCDVRRCSSSAGDAQRSSAGCICRRLL
jgi:hypothetical protein